MVAASKTPAPESPLAEFAKIRWAQLRKEPRKAVAAALVDSVLVVKLANGAIATSGGGRHYRSLKYSRDGRGFSRALVDALRMLGAISQAAADAHQADAVRRQRESSLRWDAGDLQKIAKRYGFPLTARQRKALGLPEETA